MRPLLAVGLSLRTPLDSSLCLVSGGRYADLFASDTSVLLSPKSPSLLCRRFDLFYCTDLIVPVPLATAEVAFLAPALSPFVE